MNLSGRLATTTLGDLLGALFREQATGTLELIEDKGPRAGRLHRVHLQDGQVARIESPDVAERLGERLEREGWLTAQQREQFSQAFFGKNGPVGRVLVESGWVPEPVVSRALHEQLRSRLDAIFSLPDARVAFRVARPRVAGSDPARPLEPKEFLHGRPRRRERDARAGGNPSPTGRGRLPVEGDRYRDLTRLGLAPTATRDEVRRAFRKLAAALHPDRHLHASAEVQETLRRQFVELSTAYHRLAS